MSQPTAAGVWVAESTRVEWDETDRKWRPYIVRRLYTATDTTQQAHAQWGGCMSKTTAQRIADKQLQQEQEWTHDDRP